MFGSLVCNQFQNTLSCFLKSFLYKSTLFYLFQVGLMTSASLSTKISLMMGEWMDRCCSTSLWWVFFVVFFAAEGIKQHGEYLICFYRMNNLLCFLLFHLRMICCFSKLPASCIISASSVPFMFFMSTNLTQTALNADLEMRYLIPMCARSLSRL